MGFSGFFQVYRNPRTEQFVELSERQIDVLGGDGIILAPEFNNDRVGSDPATFEALADERGNAIHNLQWVTKDRVFHLTTKHLNADEIRSFAESIASRFTVMKFDGWRQPYVFDVNNPLHRISRPGAVQPSPDR